MASASNSPLNQGIVPLLSQFNEVNNISPNFVTTEPISVESPSTPIAPIAVIPTPSSLPAESTPIVVADYVTPTIVTPETNSSSSSPCSVTPISPTVIDSTAESTPSPTYDIPLFILKDHIPSISLLPTLIDPPSSPHIVTRSQTSSLRPKVFTYFKLYYSTKHPLKAMYTSTSPSEPSTFVQATSNPHWLAAMESEFQALQENHTWSLCPRPHNKNIIRNKQV